MRHPCGHPYGTVSRDHPCSITRLHRHDATACVDQLVPLMKMRRDPVPRREIDRACNHGEALESHLVEKDIVSFWRHRLSQYRMRVLEAIPSIQPQLVMEAAMLNCPLIRCPPGSLRLRLLLAVAVGLAASASMVHAAERSPCAADAPSRALDFWLGNWWVTYPGAPRKSTSKVILTLDKCLFVETWSDGSGHNGENIFAYGQDDRTWHGLFADNRGRLHVFVEGKVAAGGAEFLGPSRAQNGESVLNRMRVTPVGTDKLQQTWEKSVDGGHTWT